MDVVTGKSPGCEIEDIRVRFWAAARSAAGTAETSLRVDGPITLADLRERLVTAQVERLGPVLAVCAVLVGDRPVTGRDPAEVWVSPGERVEFLPPYAGG